MPLATYDLLRTATAYLRLRAQLGELLVLLLVELGHLVRVRVRVRVGVRVRVRVRVRVGVRVRVRVRVGVGVRVRVRVRVRVSWVTLRLPSAVMFCTRTLDSCLIWLSITCE